MSYFPERRANDPAGIADALSESLSNEYGEWGAAYGGNIGLNPNREFGAYSISLTSGSPIDAAGLGFFLSNQLDLSNMTAFKFDIFAMVNSDLPDHVNLTGNAYVLLNDSSNHTARAPFLVAVAPPAGGGAFSPIVKNKADFEELYFPFDWAHVVNFVIELEVIFDGDPFHWTGFTILVDGGPFFTFPSSVPLLVIRSYDQNMKTVYASYGVTLTVGAAQEQLLVPFTQPTSAFSGSLTANDGADRTFVKWKKPDGSIDTARTIDINHSGTDIFEVHWKVAGGSNQLALILTIGGIIVGAGIIMGLMS